jgi:hypothetical protein
VAARASEREVRDIGLLITPVEMLVLAIPVLAMFAWSTPGSFATLRRLWVTVCILVIVLMVVMALVQVVDNAIGVNASGVRVNGQI